MPDVPTIDEANGAWSALDRSLDPSQARRRALDRLDGNTAAHYRAHAG